ncbi:MAG: LCP family protein, partial [bacterium]|nr:LCP family protein [bacterium]
ATLISIPRDLLIPTADGTREKVNAINAYAEARRGDGAATLRDALERTLDFRIPYYVRVDFRGFVGLIDAIDGIDVDVERTLDDPQYPITGMESAPWADRFERLVIPAGQQHFTGALALKYVRSRHALGIEGSDFARARRQQRLLLAVRDRAVSWGLLGNPRRLLALLETWRENVRTNLAPPELYRLSSFTAAITGTDVTRVVFSDGPGGQLIASLQNGAYVLQPRDGSFEEIRAMIRTSLQTAPSATAAPAPFSIEIWNGTTVTGLANATATSLRRAGLTVTAIRNAPSRAVERSIIYRNARVPDDIVTKLQELLRAEASTAFPASLTTGPLPDLLVVLGASAANAQ